ncbi:vacuolar protein sorting-associated protein 11, putative [Plasmodium malariae]|uniref:Vacuolar protein sorting-associated protein 11, putative n=1 Tax=Plasmodium malariae TaxID=5858 RepID=A0A1C3KB65_PLAMA|nr:vacuolar protein sorting-associated protein 11, putative [Plasmodium malariae]
MFNFRKLPLFDRDCTKDTREVKNFLNSHEGIYFSSSKKFINLFVDKLLFIDPVNLNVTTINTDLFVVDFCFNDKTNNLIVLGKSKNILICSIYNIRAHNFSHLKKIQLSRSIENIKKTLISKCHMYIITLENKKVCFYLLNNDYSINKSELVDIEEESFENMYLCKNNIFILLKKSSVNIYKLIVKDSTISYTFIEAIDLNIYTIISSNSSSCSNNNTHSQSEPILSIYNEDIDVLYICHNILKVIFVLDLRNKHLEYIFHENRVINLFAVKYYLIILTEVNRKFYVSIYIIYEDLKLAVFNVALNYLVTNIVFFNNLLFLIVDEHIKKPEIKVDKFYFYEQLKKKWNARTDRENSRGRRSDSENDITNGSRYDSRNRSSNRSRSNSISNIFKETEKSNPQNIDILKMYNDNINNNNGNLILGNAKYDIYLNKKVEERKDENDSVQDDKQFYSDKQFKLNKIFKNCRNKIKIVIKEKNINEIINLFKKKKLFLWLIKYSDLNKNYHSINFGYVHKIYADFLFEKEQYEKAMQHYIKTIGFLETVTVIHKYLNLDLYEQLSIYLEKLHESHLFNDEHTMMLLSCYKKECKKRKIISFIKNNKNKINLNKTYKFLLNVGYYNVVLNFSKKYKDHLTYISILIDKFENYEKSLKYIFKLDVENICILLFRYGYKFIKYFPELTIYLLKKIIKKYNLNLTIFIPLFLDNIDFLFIFILKFLHKKKVEQEGEIDENKTAQRSINNNTEKNRSLQNGKKKYNEENQYINESAHCGETTTTSIIKDKHIEFDIFNGEYDYILFVTVMQILLQKYKKKEKNHILSFNIDKLIKNNDKNITFLSVILLSIYNYNKGLLYLSNKMNKYDMSFLFSAYKIIKRFKIKYSQQVLVLQNVKENNKNNQLGQLNNSIFQILKKNFERNLFNSCMNLLKLKDSLFHNYIFYYLSLLNDDEFLIKFIKMIKKKSSLSLLNLISILQKYNKSYRCIKKILITYLNKMDQNINKKYAQILRNKRELYKIKKNMLTKKYNFHIIDNTYCTICKQILTVPIIHFLCNHSYHYYCLNGNKVCILCCNKDNEKKLLKEKAKNAVNNFDEFFKYLQGSSDKFSYISNYLSYGVTPNK